MYWRGFHDVCIFLRLKNDEINVLMCRTQIRPRKKWMRRCNRAPVQDISFRDPFDNSWRDKHEAAELSGSRSGDRSRGGGRGDSRDDDRSSWRGDGNDHGGSGPCESTLFDRQVKGSCDSGPRNWRHDGTHFSDDSRDIGCGSWRRGGSRPREEQERPGWWGGVSWTGDNEQGRGGEPRDEPSPADMRRVLESLNDRFQKSAWPTMRNQLDGIDGKMLYGMKRANFVDIRGGILLEWNSSLFRKTLEQTPVEIHERGHQPTR